MSDVRILLVDDSYTVLDMMKNLLKTLRKNVDIDTAWDGDEAFTLYCQRGPYDLVLTDDIHPGLGGVDFVKAIRKEHPTQPIAFLTVENEIRQTLWQEFKIPSLRKPFEKEQLDKLLRNLSVNREAALPSVSHVREVRSLLLAIVIGILIVGTLLAGMGISLVYLGSQGATSIHFFGQSFDSSNVGIVAIFLGATTIVVVLSRLMKRLHDIAGLRKD